MCFPDQELARFGRKVGYAAQGAVVVDTAASRGGQFEGAV
jgi:hypothetical protein